MIFQIPIFGNIQNPINKYGGTIGPNFGLIVFINNILKLVIVVAGIFAFIQILTAGIAFISAGGDSKKITDAWNKIWQALLGLLIVAGSFVLAAIAGYIIFGDPTAILNPKIYGPGT